MKIFQQLCLCLLTVVLATACKGDAETQTEGYASIGIEYNSDVLSSEGGEVAVHVFANCPWTAYTEDDVTLSDEGGKGGEAVCRITCPPNTSTTEDKYYTVQFIAVAPDNSESRASIQIKVRHAE